MYRTDVLVSIDSVDIYDVYFSRKSDCPFLGHSGQ